MLDRGSRGQKVKTPPRVLPNRDCEGPIWGSTFAQVIVSPFQVDKPDWLVTVKLLPNFLARPQALGAHKDHTLNADRERVIYERADLFKGRVRHQTRAWRFLKVEEILP